MIQTGSLLVRVFTSRAQIPVPGATVAVSKVNEDGRYELLSVQMTDSSGMVGPIILPAPDFDLSQSPGMAVPFANYSMMVEHPDYNMALFNNLQIFSGVETVQNVPLMPLSVPAANEESDADTTTVTPQEL